MDNEDRIKYYLGNFYDKKVELNMEDLKDMDPKIILTNLKQLMGGKP